LIRERRNAHNTFCTSRNHTAAWNQVANNIFMATGFVCTADQCRNKWNALKRGYENMARLYAENPQNLPLASPNNFDQACFTEMSDEFWGQEVINFKFGFVLLVFKQFYLHYLYLSISQ